MVTRVRTTYLKPRVYPCLHQTIQSLVTLWGMTFFLYKFWNRFVGVDEAITRLWKSFQRAGDANTYAPTFIYFILFFENINYICTYSHKIYFTYLKYFFQMVKISKSQYICSNYFHIYIYYIHTIYYNTRTIEYNNSISWS